MRIDRYRVRPGDRRALTRHRPDHTGPFNGRETAHDHLKEDIKAFERHVSRNGTIVRKFFLNVSRSVQRKRLLGRLDDPAKNWKFSATDLLEREKWGAYMSAYRDALAATSDDDAPWYVIPA